MCRVGVVGTINGRKAPHNKRSPPQRPLSIPTSTTTTSSSITPTPSPRPRGRRSRSAKRRIILLITQSDPIPSQSTTFPHPCRLDAIRWSNGRMRINMSACAECPIAFSDPNRRRGRTRCELGWRQRRLRLRCHRIRPRSQRRLSIPSQT